VRVGCCALKGTEGVRGADKEILEHDYEERTAVRGVSSLHGGVQPHGGNHQELEA